MKLKYKNKIIGELNGDVFTKKVKFSKHYMKIYDAWGLDLKMFLEHLFPKNAQIYIEDTESGSVYHISARNWAANGIFRDFGYGEQIFCPRKHFTRSDKNQPYLF